MIETERLRLRLWRDDHFHAFAAMQSDPEVMADQGGPADEARSREKFERYRRAEREQGVARWAVENSDGLFLGYAGVMPRLSEDHPLGPHHEIGWRFIRQAWGKGYATESAKAALTHATGYAGIAGIIAYTSPDNFRSQAVMSRLGLIREPSRDFSMPGHTDREWRGLVWVAPWSSPAQTE
ncbi:GNAT family N-acetyltransferase [Rhizobium rhizogenes]|uniref:GNAT family N-acetyltransferase n=1 Tax=Rhizobium rhizogenes TaxID=359 RepID=UPI0022BEB99F|nr:GNAT family N-acetyltransferase [Rhizobium rhizogenes]MCZ7463862.1 GNAT family N-acetyltransferase [Rhizobium rhizogenes]